MKKYLAPSILAADFAKLGEQLTQIETAGAHMVHLDVMDGLFVPSISFGMPLIKSIRSASNLKFDVHMMVVDPERYIKALADSGADIISIHVEACHHPAEVLKKIKNLGVTPGIAISPETSVSELRPFFQYAEEVLLMSVNPGFGGQEFIDDSFDRIEELVKLREELALDFLIEVDGGIKLDNVNRVLKCGADIVVAGSAVFKNDLAANVKLFLDAINRFGG